MTPDEWRQRVGARIERRREELRLSVRAAAAKAGFSEGQWRQMENGRRTIAKGQFVTVNPRPHTRAAACGVLGWSDDSIDRLEHGDEPRLADRDDVGLAEQLGQLNAEVDSLRELLHDLIGVTREVARRTGVALPVSIRRDDVVALAAEGAGSALPDIDDDDPAAAPWPDVVD